MLYIVRHGQTEKNKAHLLQGRSNLPLNDLGLQQAEALRDRFKAAGVRFDKVCTSPLIRAVRTAQILAPALTPVVEKRLIEMDYGPYEGMDLHDPAPEVVTFFQDFVRNPAPEGMEQLSHVTARLGTLLEELRGPARDQNILLSTHAIAMKGALEYLTPSSRGSCWSTFIGNCAAYTAQILPDGRWSVPVPFV